MIKLKKAQGELLVARKAQGHIEIILSFVIFVGFLIFMLFFLNPLSKTREKVSVINDLQEIVLNKVQSDVGKLSVITSVPDPLPPGNPGLCYNFNENNYLATDYIESVEVPSRKYIVYFCENFKSIISPNKNPICPLTNYHLGIYSEEKMIVKEKIGELITDYNTDYESLKVSLKTTDDFSFSFKEIGGSGELSVSKEVPASIEVESRDFPVRVIDENAVIKDYIFNIRAWRL